MRIKSGKCEDNANTTRPSSRPTSGHSSSPASARTTHDDPATVRDRSGPPPRPCDRACQQPLRQARLRPSPRTSYESAARVSTRLTRGATHESSRTGASHQRRSRARRSVSTPTSPWRRARGSYRRVPRREPSRKQALPHAPARTARTPGPEPNGTDAAECTGRTEQCHAALERCERNTDSECQSV